MVSENHLFSQYWDEYKKLKIDKSEISSDKVDLSKDRRTNPFDYKGQFSPDFVKVMLKNYSSSDDSILDPFMGCGTTVFEGLRLRRPSFGVEINPYPVEMARLAEFFSIPKSRRKILNEKALSIAQEICDPKQKKLHKSVPIKIDLSPEDSLTTRLSQTLEKGDLKGPIRDLLINSFLKCSKNPNSQSFIDEVKHYTDFVQGLPEVNVDWGVFQNDARFIPIKTNSIDLVFTSPPYINVHNYHQQKRDYMENLGWDLLKVAKSEFGSNRKNRQNRFLTVIQFSLDMYQVFRELNRIIKEGGTLIFVVGRTSTVRGVEFNNGRLLSGIANLAGFNLVKKQERKYKNNFGTLVFEDILHFKRKGEKPLSYAQLLPTEFAKGALEKALKSNEKLEEDVEEDIKAALDKNSPQPSPLFSTDGKNKSRMKKNMDLSKSKME